MALPGSGALSLSQIAAEFSKAAPYSLSDFYKGGAYVPNTTTNAAVPTSGAIKITDFYGASAALPGWTITEGNNGVYQTGYSLTGSPTYGSISGNTTINGANIRAIYQHRANVKGSWVYQFYVHLSGARSAGFFNSITIDGFGTLNEAAATSRAFALGDGHTGWYWDATNVTGIDGSGTTTGSFA